MFHTLEDWKKHINNTMKRMISDDGKHDDYEPGSSHMGSWMTILQFWCTLGLWPHIQWWRRTPPRVCWFITLVYSRHIPWYTSCKSKLWEWCLPPLLTMGQQYQSTLYCDEHKTTLVKHNQMWNTNQYVKMSMAKKSVHLFYLTPGKYETSTLMSYVEPRGCDPLTHSYTLPKAAVHL